MHCYEFNDMGGVRFWVAASKKPEALRFAEEACDETTADYSVAAIAPEQMQAIPVHDDDSDTIRTLLDIFLEHEPSGKTALLAHSEA